MTNSYKTPGVYVREIRTLPASVAQVPTAIPAFVGYTERSVRRGVDVQMQAVRIGSRVEFESIFGASLPLTDNGAQVTLSDKNIQRVSFTKRFFLYDAIRLFFDNGGGDCYIVSVGQYGEADEPDVERLIEGLEEVERHDEPTLLAVPDAVQLSVEDAGRVHQQMLKQCSDLKDRFALLDICQPADSDGTRADVAGFRQRAGLTGLKYGAAYAPWLKTAYPMDVRFEQIALQGGVGLSAHAEGADVAIKTHVLRLTQNKVTTITEATNELLRDGTADTLADAIRADPTAANLASLCDHGIAIATQLNSWSSGDDLVFGSEDEELPASSRETLKDAVGGIITREARKALRRLAQLTQFGGLIVDEGGVALALAPEPAEDIAALLGSDIWSPEPLGALTPEDLGLEGGEAVRKRVLVLLEKVWPELSTLIAAVNLVRDHAVSLRETDEAALYEKWPLYTRIVDAVARHASEVPPSGAVAGCYARVDNDRGVWKAPANISLAGVVGLTRHIDDRQQQDLNVDVDGGKSVNAIRTFSGRGILVWGARTLAGNDNEWRYVPVRRLFIMIEESVQKSMAPLVFEPNDANTWLKIQAMVENYLNGLWRAGALAGATPDAAYFVNVGLGKTMTAEDVLEGRLIVEIGLAAVRPAEFIILKFSHKMQSA